MSENKEIVIHTGQHTPSHTDVYSGVLENTLGILGACLVLLLAYIRKKIWRHASKLSLDLTNERTLYRNLDSIIFSLKADRVILYEFDSKDKLVLRPCLEVTSPGIGLYVQEDKDIPTKAIIAFLCRLEQESIIKTVVSEITNSHCKGEFSNAGVNYAISKMITYDRVPVGLLLVHYCKNGKQYFEAATLTDSDVSIVQIANILGKKSESFLAKLVKPFI